MGFEEGAMGFISNVERIVVLKNIMLRGRSRLVKYMALYLYIEMAVYALYSVSIGKWIQADAMGIPCGFNASEVPTSTRRDAVLLYATSFTEKLSVVIKSLRATGAGCRIVMLWGGQDMSWVASKFFAKFEVDVVENCFDKSRKNVPHMIRYEYEEKWLRENAGKIDRVLHTDAYDVFFQGDPFTSHIRKDVLTFVVEPHCFRSCGWNLAWLDHCYPKSVQKMLHNFIVCSGSIAGPASEYLKLIQLMTQQREWKTCWDKSLDQPILNYLLWNGHIRDHGINYTFTSCDGGFLTVQWCAVEDRLRENEHNQITSIMGSVPSYIHQYDRLPLFQRHIYEKCVSYS